MTTTSRHYAPTRIQAVAIKARSWLLARRGALGWALIAVTAWTSATLFTGPAWYGIASPPLVTGQAAVVVQAAALIVTIAAALRAAILNRREKTSEER